MDAKNSLEFSGNVPAGVRDFYPEDMLLREWLFNIWSNVSKQFGYNQYDAPILECAELYTRKGGDDILNEMYSFEKHNVKLALRPEMTPSAVRMAMNKLPTSVQPLKWFSISQCWRYEEPTKGRKREHYQWNVDIFGADYITSEVELLVMIISFLKKVGLTCSDVIIKISNRQILYKILSNMGCTNELFLNACTIIDKIHKLPEGEIKSMLKTQIELSDENISKVITLSKISNFDEILEFMGDDNPIYVQMNAIFNILRELGLDKWVKFDASIVRGLSYYTGIVFEAFSLNTLIKRSICGGGRYDDLFSKYGYRDKIPSIGFGFGDVVILEILKELQKLPILSNACDFMILPYDIKLLPSAIHVSQCLQDKGFNVEIYNKINGKGRISGAYNYAQKKEIPCVIFIAPDEWKNNKIVVKKMFEKNQHTIDFTEFINNMSTKN